MIRPSAAILTATWRMPLDRVVVPMPKAQPSDIPAMILVAVLAVGAVIVAIFNGIPFRN